MSSRKLQRLIDHRQSAHARLQRLFDHRQSAHVRVQRLFDHRQSAHARVQRSIDHRQSAHARVQRSIDHRQSVAALLSDKSFIDISTEIDYVNFEDRTNTIIRNLTNCKTFKIRNIPEITDEVTDNFSLINNLLLEEDLGGVSAISYINTLIKVLFTKDQQQHLAYIQIKEKGKREDEYKNSEVINYNPNEERIHKHDYTMGIPTLEGYNFIYRDGSLEYLTKRKARKVIEDSMNIDIDVLSNKGGSL